MAESGTKRRWGRALAYAFGILLFLFTVVATTQGAPWYLAVIVLCAAIIIMLGQRRIFRPSVTRTVEGIICRYIPWYEGNAYLFCLLFPLMGVAAIAAGRDPGNPAWLQFVGIMLLSVAVLLLWSVVHVWRRSVLRIAPSGLTLRSGTLGSKLTEIGREQVESINPMIVTTNAVSGQSLQVEVAYHPGDTPSDEIKTVLLGPHLTVKPINLANALTAWDDAAIDDPDELLDLIERILRSKSVSDVTPPPSRSAREIDCDAPEDGSIHE